MITTTKNYVLTYIDINNEEVIINSKGDEDTIESKPFYVSLENARKGKKKIENFLKKQYVIDRLKHWYDKGIALSDSDLDEPDNRFLKSSIKSYKDMLLIQKNGLNIREINISINLKKVF